MPKREAPRPLPPTDLLDALDVHLGSGKRRIIGVVGAPGAGKSTLAAAVHAARPDSTTVVPMDGFHLAQSALQSLGRAGRKGAPDTFDAAGYVALLQRIRSQRPGDAAIWAPAFERAMEEPVAGSIAVSADVPVVITEGNYLLLDESPWPDVAALLDEVWYLDVDHPTRLSRLVARHVAHGRSPEAARAWVDNIDEPNARQIEASQCRATRTVRWLGDG